MYEFRNLESVGLDELTKTWNLAFSDYVVPVNVTQEKLEAYFKIAGVDFSKSFGVFCEGDLVGMLMNSVDMFRGKIVAYDAMTGIVPEHRGKGLFSKLFEYTRIALKSVGITHYYLEVIKTNDRACSIYKAKGGKIEGEFSFLKGRVESENFNNKDKRVLPLSSYPVEELSTYDLSFSNRMSALHRNIDDYKVASAETEKGRSSVVFSASGRIPQIMYSGPEDNASLRTVMAYLSRDFKVLEIINIPVTETELLGELLDMGFQVLVDQYEMCIEL